MNKTKKQIISETVKILKKDFADDAAGHGWLHLERVWNMAKKLASDQQVDIFLIEMSALLHDVDDYKFKKPGEEGLSNTRKILTDLKVDVELQNKIYDIVSLVSFKGGHADDKQKTLEGKIVQDADRLDVLGAIGIARVFAYGGTKNHPIYDPEVKPRQNITFIQYQEDNPSINHFYEKIILLKDRLNTPQAKKIAEHRHQYILDYLKEFWAEVEGNS
jgi:uncharacterized protein